MRLKCTTCKKVILKKEKPNFIATKRYCKKCAKEEIWKQKAKRSMEKVIRKKGGKVNAEETIIEVKQSPTRSGHRLLWKKNI